MTRYLIYLDVIVLSTQTATRKERTTRRLYSRMEADRTVGRGRERKSAEILMQRIVVTLHDTCRHLGSNRQPRLSQCWNFPASLATSLHLLRELLEIVDL
jgi:hypothetical protein